MLYMHFLARFGFEGIAPESVPTWPSPRSTPKPRSTRCPCHPTGRWLQSVDGKVWLAEVLEWASQRFFPPIPVLKVIKLEGGTIVDGFNIRVVSNKSKQNHSAVDVKWHPHPSKSWSFWLLLLIHRPRACDQVTRSLQLHLQMVL